MRQTFAIGGTPTSSIAEEYTQTVDGEALDTVTRLQILCKSALCCKPLSNEKIYLMKVLSLGNIRQLTSFLFKSAGMSHFE